MLRALTCCLLITIFPLPCRADDQSTSQKYMDHLASIQKIIEAEHNRCLRSTDLANCIPSKEFQSLVDSMLQDMVKNSEQLPEKYVETLMQGSSSQAMDELLRKYRDNLEKSTPDPTLKDNHTEEAK